MSYSRLNCLIKLRNLLRQNADEASIASANASLKIIKRKENERKDKSPKPMDSLDVEINRLNFEISKLYSKKTPLKRYTTGDPNLVSLAKNAQSVADQAKNIARSGPYPLV
jgi:hypothetical protein